MSCSDGNHFHSLRTNLQQMCTVEERRKINRIAHMENHNRKVAEVRRKITRVQEAILRRQIAELVSIAKVTMVDG